MPAVSAVGSPLKTVFDFVVFSRSERVRPSFDAALEVIRMQHLPSTPALRLLEREARVIEPRLVVVIETAIRPRGPDDLRHAVGEKAVALLARPQGGCAQLNLAHHLVERIG